MTNNIKFNKGTVYIIETPNEDEVNRFFTEYNNINDEVFIIDTVWIDYLKDEYEHHTIDNLMDIFDVKSKILPDYINVNLKIKELDFFPLKCIDYTIKSKNSQIVTTFEAMSSKSREDYINFLKEYSNIYKDKYVICIDYRTTKNDIETLNIYKI